MNCHAAKYAIGRFYARDVDAVLILKSCAKRGRPKLGRLLNVQLVQKRLESVTVLRFCLQCYHLCLCISFLLRTTLTSQTINASKRL